MNFFKDNLDKLDIGFKGETIIREFFKAKGISFMQVDIMFNNKNKWFLGEIKTQEKYLSPPFDGHGLPQWQIDMRIKFYNDTKIIPYLFIYCLTDKCIYYGNLLELNNLDKFSTKGKFPRVIFNIKNFKKLN